MIKKLFFILIFSGFLIANGDSLSEIDQNTKSNIWLAKYSSFKTYKKLQNELTALQKSAAVHKKQKSKKAKEIYRKLNQKIVAISKQLELLKDFKNTPFLKMYKPKEIKEFGKVSNPFAIMSAFSYIKQLRQDGDNYQNKINSLAKLIKQLENKEEILAKNETFKTRKNIKNLQNEIETFQNALDIATVTNTVYQKNIDEAIIAAGDQISKQAKKMFYILIVLFVVIFLSFLLKYVIKRYIKDDEKYYVANKIINFTNITIIFLILLLSYIENITYLVTIVGFASAGIAIAMKDWFVSIIGWNVIFFGGSFKVGDRIKVQKDGLTYVGDIIDISLLRMSIYEDITLTTYDENRRAGRIIFVPNNYIFTNLIANYTHEKLRTVWDGIDIVITFDSNYKRAMSLTKDIARTFSKGYTDMARKGFSALRHHYSFKNTNVEPRVFSFIVPHGICISTWYMTNSHATLTLRSKISSEIVEAIKSEEDIKISYPTQTIKIGRKANEKSIF